jgi:ATP-dependent Lon protease
MATAIVSRLTGIAVRRDIAMTGEVTLTGKVLPIGGLREKSLAAMRLGITKIIIPFKNIKDLEDIADEYRSKLEFIPVKHFDEVLTYALTSVLEAKIEPKQGGGGTKKKRAPSHPTRERGNERAA